MSLSGFYCRCTSQIAARLIWVFLLIATGAVVLVDAVAQSAVNTPDLSLPVKRTANKTPHIAFDIPAQPLQSALERFGEMTGFSGLYDPDTVRGKQSSAVLGAYTPEMALAMLLASSGLVAHYTTENAFVLEVTTSIAAPVRDMPFNAQLQAAIRLAFCRSRQIAPGDYRVALRFYVDATGNVHHPELLDTTGDSTRDRMIVALVGQVRLGRPPANVAEPFYMVILPHALQTGQQCA